MMKERYFRYSLIAMILLLGWLIAGGLWSFASGLLGAFTLYVLVRGQMNSLTEKRGMTPVTAAVLIILEVSVCLLAPVYFTVWSLVVRIQEVRVDISQLVATVQHFISLVQEKTGYDVLSAGNIEAATGYITRSIQFVISQVGGLLVTSAVMIFLLYFMLVGSRKMEEYVYGLLPFDENGKHAVMGEIRSMVRSNAIGIPLLAVIQGLVAIAGYWAAGVPSPFLFGAVTAFATIVPFLGTGLVWAPLVAYLALTGDWIAAAGLAAYCGIVLVNIDNVIRFILQKRLADTHPLITVFGVILGIRLFGFWGVIFGPLLLSMFFLLVDIFKKEYLDNKQ
ncbi:MAG: AI-2E family transporter [Tannerella sp.]|jgi:predicted PurR-regulated permease PerM|nr:AI-2E family transporter [Tannerella sp.]